MHMCMHMYYAVTCYWQFFCVLTPSRSLGTSLLDMLHLLTLLVQFSVLTSPPLPPIARSLGTWARSEPLCCRPRLG